MNNLLYFALGVLVGWVVSTFGWLIICYMDDYRVKRENLLKEDIKDFNNRKDKRVK